MPCQLGRLDYTVKTNLKTVLVQKDQSYRLNQITKWFN
jgi:hypothetical protein